MILGLKRGKVLLVPHQPQWSVAFETERRELSLMLGEEALAIEHVGSTAVPGLDAKPVIDIVVAVRSWSAIESWPVILARADYTYFGDRKGWSDHFFAKGPEESRTHYLHVVLAGSPRWSDYLKFRGALREDSKLRAEYAALKHRAAAGNPDDRKSYTAAKDVFIRSVLKR